MTTTGHPSAEATSRDHAVAGRPTSLARLVAIELRKTVDTRAGRWLLLLVVGAAVAALVYRLVNAADEPADFSRFFGTALTGVQLLLPVVGVLAMTAEWTQRTALATFTLVPRRGRVIAAKFLAAVGLSAGVVLVVAGIAAVATLAGGLATGHGAVWTEVGRTLGGGVVSVACNVVMGAAFGALLQQTAAALVLYFVAPVIWAAAAPVLLGDAARWLDVFGAFTAISRFDLTGVVAPTLVALAVWVGLPLAAGVVRSLRREVA
ncbi:hypothetical protein ACVGVM_26485 [Pseudonocardia bannensis]|uniref:ABC transporter permease n=1 Tax=Pseudonocardia bannensis TaxID=630973 RepID=A0A848DDY6_9PSEU|nr:ABC transporter permease [Pseudonocardia bannensis]NMH90777.1 ABC transporter permease [Pseudonocardia bannensis]